MAEIRETLAARGSLHGDYQAQADDAVTLKRFMRGRARDRLTMVQEDAIDMICVKLSRIVNGDPNHADHWHDIAGYATLAADRCAKLAAE